MIASTMQFARYPSSKVAKAGGCGSLGLLALGDEPVDIAHQVRERVGPRFLVPSGEVRVAAGFLVEQGGILRQDLVGLVPAADPELVLLFLPPAERRGRAADLELAVVLVPRAHLADREAPLRAVVESHQHRGEILDLDVHLLECLIRIRGGKRLARALRLLALRDHGRDVAEHVRDLQAADVLREIAPVRPDVPQRRRGAAFVGLEPPGIVGVLEEPVLQVVADEKVRLADVAARDRVPRLLHERVAAVVEGDGVDDAGFRGLVEKLLPVRRRHRQRLVRDDVLALGDRRGVDRVVEVVRRRVVHDLDLGIGEQRLVAAIGPARPERLRLLVRRRLAAARDGDHVHVPETPDGIHVMRAHEPRTDNPHPYPFHDDSSTSNGRARPRPFGL